MASKTSAKIELNQGTTSCRSRFSVAWLARRLCRTRGMKPKAGQGGATRMRTQNAAISKARRRTLNAIKLLNLNVKVVAGGLGFEPRLTESESAVLPLNYPPSGKSNQIRSGIDQASQAGAGSRATAADRRLPTQRGHIYGIWRRFPSGVGEGGFRAGQKLSAAAAGPPLGRDARKRHRLSA
jgi:hypothetical protein